MINKRTSKTRVETATIVKNFLLSLRSFAACRNCFLDLLAIG